MTSAVLHFLRVARVAVCLAATFTVALGSDPDPAEQAYQEGAAAMRAREYERAIEALGRAATLRPDHAKTWLGLGMAHSAQQDWEAAVEAYTHMVEADPSNPIAHNNLGNAHFRRGEYEPAAESYRRAIELDENYLLAMFQYGWTLRQMNREAEAEPVFRRCLETPAESPRDKNNQVDCAFGLGSVRHRAGDYAASAALMEQVLAVHPGHHEARHYLGMAYRQLGRLEDAQRELELHRKMLEERRKQGAAFDRPDP